ncbi:Na(+)/H(+) antiporter subunit C1 [Microbulbifer aggregans]|uniref:Na(+)/H(+) antiporter subunit C1 n=1 Tax=Microbulbifer aggregans TaxID=1769779 RepID=A0A1C9W3H1_9GAMM|nr:Na+/H+ antiporter subunit C [Microbulbifer aggregans]AOS95691.1 Na(+)/H(+) antiporter subunit C1 [Microbulbifer aggregans]
MEMALALVIGILTATGVYLMLARNLLRYLFGLILLSNAANLAIFTAGRLTRASPPLIPEGLKAPDIPVANPLPQALILTAIVIGFGLLAFSLALIVRAYRRLGTLDADDMRIAEPKKKTKRGTEHS